MSLNRLRAIAPPPAVPKETGTPKTWDKVEQRLGIPLPAEYKAFIDHYGTGGFDGFIDLYNPFAANDYYNLFQALDAHHQASRRTQFLADSGWTAVRPFELYPAPNGLVPWGTTPDFGLALFWQTGNPPQTWPTVFYNLRNGEYEVWKLPCTGFLAEILSGKARSVLLPDDFPPKKPGIVFCPYVEEAR